jgi:hypothetical protein
MTIKKLSDRELMQKFIDAALIQTSTDLGTREGVKKANKASDTIRKIYKELEGRPDGIAVFQQLFDHPAAAVRVWAGPFGLTHFPEQYEPMLEEIAKGPPHPLRFEAQMLLDAWRQGLQIV